jgi:phosphatidylglycerol lysyltransferase
MVWVLFFAFRNVEYAHQLWWQFEFDATAPRAMRAALAVAMLGLALGVWQLLSPAKARPALPTSEQIERARQIAAKQSRPDALLALMGDKSLLFSESGRTFLTFATRGRTWVVLGDPVGPPVEWPELVWRFIELADSHGGVREPSVSEATSRGRCPFICSQRHYGSSKSDKHIEGRNSY